MFNKLKINLRDKIDNFALGRISRRNIIYCNKCNKPLIFNKETKIAYCPNCQQRLKFLEENKLNWKDVNFDGTPPMDSVCVCLLINKAKVTRYDVIRYNKNYKEPNWKILRWKIIDF